MQRTSLDELWWFVTLVDAGSLTAAAQQLGMPKSKLSRHLAQLERHLQCQLLQRTTRRQRLTESGMLLYRACKPHLEALANVEQDVNALMNEPSGHLSLLLPLEFFNEVISTLICDFALRYPKIHLSCHHYSGNLLDADAQYDLTFVLHEQPLPSSNWIAKNLLSFPQSIYAGVGDNLSQLRQPQDLQQAMAILADEQQTWLFRAGDNVQSVAVQRRIVLSSPEMRISATRRRLGITKLPDYLGNADRQLQKVPLSHAVMAQQLSVLYQTRQLPMKTRVFLDYFQSHIGRLS